MGRPKKLDKTKALQGTLRPCRAETPTPGINLLTLDDVEKIKPNLPTTKVLGEYGMMLFKDTLRYVAQMGILEHAHVHKISMYAYWGEMFFKTAENINKQGLIDFSSDKAAENPHIKIAAKATEMLEKIGKGFGMSPLSKQSLKITKSQIDPMRAIMKAIE